MKKTLAILALALVVVLCCVSCGGKEVTITLDVATWNKVAQAKGLPELKLSGEATFKVKKGENFAVPTVLKDGKAVQTNWTLSPFTDTNVPSNNIFVIKGMGEQLYKPNDDVTLYAYDV